MTAPRVASSGTLWMERASSDAPVGSVVLLVADPDHPGDYTIGAPGDGPAVAEFTASGPGGDYVLGPVGTVDPSVPRATLLQIGTDIILL